jgi:hypothetical protein
MDGLIYKAKRDFILEVTEYNKPNPGTTVIAGWFSISWSMSIKKDQLLTLKMSDNTLGAFTWDERYDISRGDLLKNSRAFDAPLEAWNKRAKEWF